MNDLTTKPTSTRVTPVKIGTDVEVKEAKPRPRAKLKAVVPISAQAKRLAEQSRAGHSRTTSATGSGLHITSIRLQQASAVPVFAEITREVKSLTEAVRRGKIDDAELERRLAELPRAPDEEFAALWSPAQTRERRALQAAFEGLSALRPNTILYRGNTIAEQTLREGSLYAHVQEARHFPSGRGELERYAKKFLAEFPNSPRAPYVQKLLDEVTSSSGGVELR